MDPILMPIPVPPPAIVEPAEADLMHMHDELRFDPKADKKRPQLRYHIMQRNAERSTPANGRTDYSRRRQFGRKMKMDMPRVKNQMEMKAEQTGTTLEDLRARFENRTQTVREAAPAPVVMDKIEHPVTDHTDRLEVYETTNYVEGVTSLRRTSPFTDTRYVQDYDATLVNGTVLSDRNELVQINQDEQLVDAIRNNGLNNTMAE